MVAAFLTKYLSLLCLQEGQGSCRLLQNGGAKNGEVHLIQVKLRRSYCYVAVKDLQ
jgi:hypothetical protein